MSSGVMQLSGRMDPTRGRIVRVKGLSSTSRLLINRRVVAEVTRGEVKELDEVFYEEDTVEVQGATLINWNFHPDEIQ